MVKQLAKQIAHGVLVDIRDLNVTPKNFLMLLPVPKKDDDGKQVAIMNMMRIVVDSRPANDFTEFCGIQTDNLEDSLQFAGRTSRNGLNLKADIADAYYTIPLGPELSLIHI